MDWVMCIVLCAVALVVTILLVPPVRKLANKLGAIDYPGARRVNKEPIARLGGLAIFGGIVAAILVAVIGVCCGIWKNPFVPHPELNFNYLGVGFSVIVMFAVGFVDDLKDLPPKVKLLGQVVAACIAVASGLLLDGIHIPFGDFYLHMGWLAYPVTVFYLVAFANIINLIDGLDGLAAGITAISALAMFAFTVMSIRPDVAILCLILFGACVGFLRYNFNPASIFMGDCGALLLGFSLGCVSLMAIARATLFMSLLLPIVAAGVPIIDTATSIVRRMRAHKPIDQADKGHIHHRLLNAGYSQRKTVAIMWAWTAALSLCAVLMNYFRGYSRYVMALIVLVITIFVICRLHLIKPVLQHHYGERPKGNAQAGEADIPGKAQEAPVEGEGADPCSSAQAPPSDAQSPAEYAE